MKKSKKYPTISSREIQRNFSTLRDALDEYGGAYISYYNNTIAKVIAESSKAELDGKEEDNSFESLVGMFEDRLTPELENDYKEVYRKELKKKYGL